MSEDLIRRSDAIKAMEQRYQDILSIFKRKVKDGEKAIALDMMGCIKSLPSADRPQGWIPCSERLPSEKDYTGDVVIWCTDKSIVGVGWYYESTKSWATIDDTFPPILGEVIAWMPLPKPWKGADYAVDAM